MAALIIAIFPQNSSRGNWEEQQDRTDPNSQFELARKPAWLLAFRQFGLPKWKHDFEGRETAKTPYISAQVRIKYVPKACKKGLFSYLVICVRMTLQLHFSRPGTIWAPRAPFRTRRTHE